MSRPEHIAPPEIYYGHDEAKKYAQNTRIIEIQSAMTERALQLLNLPADRPAFLLDIGCGSGLSGEVLSENGHTWVGLDISPSMLGMWCASVSCPFVSWWCSRWGVSGRGARLCCSVWA